MLRITEFIPESSSKVTPMRNNKIGVVLLNMGGPSRLEDVRPFLFNIFSDREIIRLGPAFLQKPIAWFIARKRAPKSMAIYEKIGGGSPIAEITHNQQCALETELRKKGAFTVVTAMRYWHPTTEEALKILAEERVKTIVALSLYPHFSCATSGSSLNALKQNLHRLPSPVTLHEIVSWHSHPGYIQCLAEKITAGLRSFGNDNVELLYSAHSLPVSFIEEGDPYVDHLMQTIKNVEKITGKQGRICYQSRSGPVEWLSPSTPEMIKKVSKEDGKNILMVPISFVSDHVETLYEINMEYRELAAGLGMELKMTEALNTTPQFIAALRDLVLSVLKM